MAEQLAAQWPELGVDLTSGQSQPSSALPRAESPRARYTAETARLQITT